MPILTTATRAIFPALCLVTLGVLAGPAAAQRVPQGQDKPPGPPLSPDEAVKRMTVPEDFRVELVASEPDIVNPVAMTWDEKGRLWITESVEYPRSSAGPGRDRVKVLEDTDGDGRMDKFTVFADGLNIPSGIAVGHGGVWVANAPDILFLQDTDGDGKADQTKVVVTGFGRADTHELPNSLTWGPDGWLYGLNGVFNQCDVKHRGKQFQFTCALFRINPRADSEGPWKGTHDFELFCEGTSNPWGVAFDGEGSAFVSACVIDHLWHLSETGYYHRQGGPYPAFTWKIDSIVKHQHQKAAYCGLHYFDSDAYPEPYRDRLYMGNIHGNCVNVDVLERDGSTYFAKPAPDFLSAGDPWSMPVAQKTGPDGCLYILDWYDRYHCYQDARRDPEGIDRLKGRLYRVRYKDSPRAASFDLASESDDQLIERLASPNIYFRDIAQRLLAERGSDVLRAKLQPLVFDASASRKTKLHALWALIGMQSLQPTFHERLLAHEDATFRAWGVRAAGNMRTVEPAVRDKVTSLAADPAPDVRLQVAIAARKIAGVDPITLLASVLDGVGNDRLIPHIVWQNLYPLLDSQGGKFLQLVESKGLHKQPAAGELLSRVIENMLSDKEPDADAFARLFVLLQSGGQTAAAGRCLAVLAQGVQTGQINAEQSARLRPLIESQLQPILSGGTDNALFQDAIMLAATWNDPKAISVALKVLGSKDQSNERRLQALEALVSAGNTDILDVMGDLLTDTEAPSVQLRGMALAALGRLDDPRVAEIVLGVYARLDPQLRSRAVELLTQRAHSSKALLAAIGREEIPRSALNLTQLRKLVATGDPALLESVEKIWGRVRADRNPARAKVVDRIRTLVQANIDKGDPQAGQAVFVKKCAVCHTIYGEGEKLGPDITLNGRASFDQLLSNVLDPNLVVGNDYQARIVTTTKGRTLIGLLAEENNQRIVLRLQGGKNETLARGDVEALEVSQVSFMPEGLEEGLTDKEIVDLFTLLALDRPANDPNARLIAGTRPLTPRETTDPGKFQEILDAFAPGFSIDRVGERGLAIVAQHYGRSGVLRTHPVARGQPCIVRSTVDVPKQGRTFLLLSVSHEPGGADRDWQLIVKANDQVLHDSVIGEKTTTDHWADLSVDLTRFAGQTVKLELQNKDNNWNHEFAYWGHIAIVTE